jgi:hypothetical protein
VTLSLYDTNYAIYSIIEARRKRSRNATDTTSRTSCTLNPFPVKFFNTVPLICQFERSFAHVESIRVSNDFLPLKLVVVSMSLRLIILLQELVPVWLLRAEAKPLSLRSPS